jgi:hypothetical protein
MDAGIDTGTEPRATDEEGAAEAAEPVPVASPVLAPVPAAAPPPVAAAAVAVPQARPAPIRPCQITFKGMVGAEGPRSEVRAWLEKLGALTAPMTGGHLVIELVDRGAKETHYQVHLDLTMPSGIVIVPLDHPNNAAHEDIFVAIRNAFRAARRQLDLYFQSHPGDVRPDEPRPVEARPADGPGLSPA